MKKIKCFSFYQLKYEKESHSNSMHFNILTVYLLGYMEQLQNPCHIISSIQRFLQSMKNKNKTNSFLLVCRPGFDYIYRDNTFNCRK